MILDCAALLAAFAGLTIEQLDRSRVYEIPLAQIQTLSIAQRTFARACAVKHGIRYKVVSK